MPRPPEQPPQREARDMPFQMASRFDSRETSQTPYDTIQAIVRQKESDFSVFRLIQNWPESMSKAPPSTKKWYVAVIGNPPPEPLAKQVTDAINQGEVVPLPDEVLQVMRTRRLEETATKPYAEIHRTFTFTRRKDHSKEKMKNKTKKNSRRQNRGK